MVTPRRTRLVRVPDPARFQQALAIGALGGPAGDARDTAVLVPALAAADALRRTFEELCLIDRWQPSPAELEVVGRDGWSAADAFILPHLVTRGGWYDLLASRLDRPLPLVGRLEREVLFERAAARAVASGAAPPFGVRPALVAEMQTFYDALGRRSRSIEDFERLVGGPLEAGAGIDRGARRLLEQTRFLAATFREYEQALADGAVMDEQRLRDALIDQAPARPLRRLVISIPDQAASAAGLFPADYDLLMRLPGLESIVVVATEATLGTGYLPRLLDALPEIDVRALGAGPSPAPRLAAPGGGDRLFFVSRDREEELTDFARRHGAPAGSGATAFVYQRPLPYLALARQVLDSQGLAWQAVDAQPLAAEPYAAALDLVLTLMATEYARGPSMALLRAPHFRFGDADGPLSRAEVAACDRELREAYFFGGRERLVELRDRWQSDTDVAEAEAGTAAGARPARSERAARAGRRRRQASRSLNVLLRAIEPLRSLDVAAPPSVHLRVLADFMRAVEAAPSEDRARERWLRARSAVLAIVHGLAAAFESHGESPRSFADLAALLRRLLEEHTFNPRIGPGAVHLIDAESAPYGRFTHVTLAGVVEGEWPAGGARGIFYPSSLLRDLGWPAEADRRTAARAAFDDLLRLPSQAVAVSTFSLDDDAIVRPSSLAEDLERAGLAVERSPVPDPDQPPRVLRVVTLGVGAAGEQTAWRTLRASRRPMALDVFHGATGALAPRPYAVTSIDRYRQCPFKYFAADVLRLEEEPDNRPGLTVQERGRFVHEVFRDFYARWARDGQGGIEAPQMDAARALFARVVDEHLEGLPDSERALERTRLMGSIAGAGLGERTFRFEAARSDAIVERLLEFPLDGAYEINGQTLRLSGTADRIDLLADGSLRVLDYKTGKASSAKETLQIPVYALLAERRLAGHGGRSWRVSEAGYLAFGRPEPFVSILSAADRDQRMADAADALVETAAAIERGAFPVAPVEPHMCIYCGFAGVCRKDYVEEV